MPELYRGKFDLLFETSNPGADPVEFWPQGGGFTYSLPHGTFHDEMKPAAFPYYRLIKVTGDWWEHYPEFQPIEAYGNGRCWNGWAVPYFHLAGAMEVARRLPRVVEFDPATLTVTVHGQTVKPETITINSIQTMVWQIGDGWCWDEVPS